MTMYATVLQGLFDKEPGVRNHLIDDDGKIRTHVLVFVDGERAELSTPRLRRSRGSGATGRQRRVRTCLAARAWSAG